MAAEMALGAAPGTEPDTLERWHRDALSEPGRIVLKPADDAEEAEWIAGLFERLEGPGFRVPGPVRTRAGPWLCERWVAWEFLDAQHAGPNGGRWPGFVVGPSLTGQP